MSEEVEVNICCFCHHAKPVIRTYLYPSTYRKPSKDYAKLFNKGNYFAILYTCNDCGKPVEVKHTVDIGIKLEMKIKFRGIDSFNRPVYKHINSTAHFDSTNTLRTYSRNPGIYEIMEIDRYFRNNIHELEYFGTSFNCEPHGGENNKYELIIID
jgi:hypothetical protein